MSGSSIFVSNATQLTAALKASTGGETIHLGSGNYGDLLLSRLSFANPVTIVGGNFNSVRLSTVEGLHFESPVVSFSPTATSNSNSQAFRIWDSHHVTVNNAKMSGEPAINGVAPDATRLDSTGNVLGLPVGKGIQISSSSNVTVSNSDISKFHKGIMLHDSNDVTIADNKIYDLRTTPISGSVTSNLTITGNHTYNSFPWNFGANGDHGDRIHIWTTKTPITGLVIADNNLEQGTGAPMR